MKEWKGIIFGCVAVFVIPIVIFGYLSKENIRTQTEPLLEETVETPDFKAEKFSGIIHKLKIGKITGYLFQEHPQRPIYAPVFIGKSPEGAAAVRSCFPNAKAVDPERIASEVSALRLTGVEPGDIFAAEGNGRDSMYFCGDCVIFSPEPQSTSVYLDDLQRKHFLYSYLKK